jgi:hypothetical protein
LIKFIKNSQEKSLNGTTEKKLICRYCKKLINLGVFVFKNAWNWLDGKKTIIAASFWTVVLPTLNAIYPNGIPTTLNKTTIIIGTFLGSVGLGHKAIKKFAS